MNDINNNNNNPSYAGANPAEDLYAAPQAIDNDRVLNTPNPIGCDDSPWYAINGRIGRIQLLAYNFIWTLISLALSTVGTVLNSSILMMIFILPLLVSSIYTLIILPRRRLHDLDRSGLFLLLYFVPFINIILIIYMMFWPGNAGFNRFGAPPQPNTKVHIIFASLLIIFYVVAIVAAILFPMSVYGKYINEEAELTIEDEVDASIEAQIAEIEAQMEDETNDNLEPSDSASYTEDVQINEDGSFTMSMEWSGDEQISQDGTDVQIMNDASDTSVDEQLEDTEAEIQAAIDEAVNDTPEMSFEEFMNSDSQILVE